MTHVLPNFNPYPYLESPHPPSFTRKGNGKKPRTPDFQVSPKLRRNPPQSGSRVVQDLRGGVRLPVRVQPPRTSVGRLGDPHLSPSGPWSFTTHSTPSLKSPIFGTKPRLQDLSTADCEEHPGSESIPDGPRPRPSPPPVPPLSSPLSFLPLSSSRRLSPSPSHFDLRV